MFGLLIPHRPVQYSPRMLSEDQFVFEVAAHPNFNNLAVFILPGQSLPPATVAAIYVRLPATCNHASPYKLVGALTMDRQTAFFRVDGFSKDSDDISGDSMNGNWSEGVGMTPHEVVAVGVSIEPAAHTQAQLHPQTSSLDMISNPIREHKDIQASANLKEVAKQVGQNALNYLNGFAQGPVGGEMVLLKRVQEWWTKFEKRLDLDASFLTTKNG